MTDSRSQLFIRMKKRREVTAKQILHLKDVAYVLAPEQYDDIMALPVYQVPENEHFVVLDVFTVAQKIMQYNASLSIESVGNTDTILEVKRQSRSASRIAFVFVWLLLFVGSGLAIMNFHTDVSMLEVHQRLYYLITGRETEHPLWIQIPYSFGIGLGMVLFFNHIFKRRFNEEPSPLEVEMNLYQESIDRYVIRHEHGKENES